MIKYPKPTDHEPVWSQYIARTWWMHAEPEFVAADGSRVDILSSEVAWEVEWAKKWQESIGQAVWYSIVTSRKGGVILLLRNKPTEKVYIARCAACCRAAGLEFQVFETRK